MCGGPGVTNVSNLMATLKQDPKAMEIFLDELVLADHA